MKVCILGNSLSSLTLAKAFVNQNIGIDLFVVKKNTKIDSYRTIGISKSNVDYFSNNIININKILWKIRKIEIFTDNLRNEKLLNFENNNSELFSIVKNYKLYEILYKSLLKDKKCNFLNFSKKDFLPENYNLIINTDYPNFITKKYFNKKIVKKYNSYAYVTIFEHAKISNNTATQIFTKHGPLAFLPISNNQTSVVFSIHNKNYKNIGNLDELIKFYNFKYKIKKCQKIKSFELKSFTLRSYYHKNILAFGDILHTIHPLAGQGFNMTIRDVKNLIFIIKKKKDLGLPIDSSVNFEFQKSFKHRNFLFLNSIDFIHELFNFERKTESNFLSKSIQTVGKFEITNRMFKTFADKGIII